MSGTIGFIMVLIWIFQNIHLWNQDVIQDTADTRFTSS
ncbi:hypothetical protein [Salmonella phage SD-2_S15]|nr:hypothetical protein [Salmonella phage SD-2_S15]